MDRIIKIHVGTGWANGDHTDEVELPVGWDKMSEKEQDNFLNECAVDLLNNTCECTAWVEEVEEPLE